MNEISQSITIVGIVLILFSSASLIHPASATPFYTQKTNHMIILTIKPVDPNGKSNNCYHEVYARSTSKNANHDLLNKETIPNPNPNNGPSKIYVLKWYYDVNKFHQSDAVNEGKIRTYAYPIQIVFGTEKNGQTITKYIEQSKEKKMSINGKTVYVIDFTEFKVITDPSLCKSLKESAIRT